MSLTGEQRELMIVLLDAMAVWSAEVEKYSCEIIHYRGNTIV